MTASIRILCQIDWLDEAETVSRLWDGGGPLVDGDGGTWRGVSLLEGLDALEQAFNAEASTINLALTGIASADADLAWQSLERDEIIGATVRFMIQDCDEADQPVGSPEVWFTGTIDNILFDDKVENDRPRSTITVEVTNRFTLRRLSRGAVLSDVDQKARSAVLNPGADPDRFCERVPLIEDKTIVWPRWN